MNGSDICFYHPFTMVVSGSTGSGKTVWLMKLLANLDRMVSLSKEYIEKQQQQPKKDMDGVKEGGVIKSVLYCYGALNDNVLSLKRNEKTNRVTTYAGLPGEDLVKEMAACCGHQLLLVLDDLMLTAGKAPLLDTLFTVGSHNWGVSVVMATQHLFHRDLRSARNNSHYIVLMRNPAGGLQVRNLAVQLFPGRTPYFLEAYGDATRRLYSYLLIDMHPITEETMRLKTHIYPDEGWTVVYVCKS
jgi:hypothetical protein